MSKSTFTQILGIALGGAVCAVAPIAFPAFAATVDAPAGRITGTEKDGLRLFQGIPYAEAPVGDLRWAPPQPKAAFSEPFEATEPGAECVQQAVFWRPGRAASWDEDCLSLTVYSPAEGGADLPVIVGFHGGGSVNGAKTDWDPQTLARRGYVVVTANYRLGALGFLALPELDAASSDGESSGNYGDLDRAQALRWVQDNIAAFGGNPNNVTIAGQSAGARGVCWLLASPETKGLFDAAIMQSGRDCPMTPKEEVFEAGQAFAEAVDCPEGDDVLACLREKSPAEIIAAQKGRSWPQTFGGSAMPVSVQEAVASGQFNKVPVILGHTRNERNAATYEGNDLQLQPVSEADYEAYVRKEFSDNAEGILSVYDKAAKEAPGLAKAAIDTDAQACGIMPFIRDLARHVPLYVYEFADETAPARPYMVIPPSFPVGSGHSAELPYVWDSEIRGELTPEQDRTAEIMTSYWTGLAGEAGMEGWPVYTADKPQRIRFLENGGTETIGDADYAKLHNCDLYGATSQ